MYHSVNSQRYGKAKGMKVKHLMQLVALTVLFTWFLYQLNISHKAKVHSLRAAEKEEDVDDELLISSDTNNWSGGLRGGVGGGGGGGRAEVDDDEASEIARDEFIDKKSVVKSRKELRPRDTTELEQITAERDSDDDGLFGESGAGAGAGVGLGGGDDRIINSEESGVKLIEKSQIEIEGGEKDDRAAAVVEDKDSLFRAKILEVTKDGQQGEDKQDTNPGEDSNPSSFKEVNASPIKLTTTTTAENSTDPENLPDVYDRTGEDTTTTAAGSSLRNKLEQNSPPIYPSEGVPDGDDVPDNVAEPGATSSNMSKEEQIVVRISAVDDVGRNHSEQILDTNAETEDIQMPPPAKEMKTDLATTTFDNNTSEEAEAVTQDKRSDEISGTYLSQDSSSEETEAVKNVGNDDSQQVITDPSTDKSQEATAAVNASSKIEAGVERGLVEEQEDVLDETGVNISGNLSPNRNPYKSNSNRGEEAVEISSPIPSMQNGDDSFEKSG